jgi:hypothetical protein
LANPAPYKKIETIRWLPIASTRSSIYMIKYILAENTRNTRLISIPDKYFATFEEARKKILQEDNKDLLQS